MPAGLCRVDVADAREDGLGEQRRLDAPTGPREPLVEHLRGHRGILGVGAKGEPRWRVRRMIGHHGERPRIDENHAATRIELEDEACVRGKRGRAPVDDPIPGHAEVYEERGAIVERDELCFPVPRDVDDASTGNARHRAGGEVAALSGMQHSEVEHASTAQGPCRTPGRELDFRELWHTRNIARVGVVPVREARSLRPSPVSSPVVLP